MMRRQVALITALLVVVLSSGVVAQEESSSPGVRVDVWLEGSPGALGHGMAVSAPTGWHALDLAAGDDEALARELVVELGLGDRGYEAALDQIRRYRADGTHAILVQRDGGECAVAALGPSGLPLETVARQYHGGLLGSAAADGSPIVSVDGPDMIDLPAGSAALIRVGWVDGGLTGAYLI